MDRPSVAIVAVTTVLAWSLATHLLPPTWWGALVTIAVGLVFAYPLRAQLGLPTRDYLHFGAALLVLVPAVHVATADRPGVRWISVALALFALAGLVFGAARRRRGV